MMSRVHPASEKKCHKQVAKEGGTDDGGAGAPCVLTVWKRSSMSFQGTDGFTVFDDKGRLAFRVDNYSRRTGGLLLMDGAGRVLLTLRPQVLSLQYQWNGFEGEEECGKRSSNGTTTPVFSMRRKSMLGNNEESEVFIGGCTRHSNKAPDFRMEGSFRRRSCSIRGPNGELVAEISRKKVINKGTLLLSDDVFSLVVHQSFDRNLAMAFVIVMDRICRKPFTPILCS
ncbi:hypothetical protein Sjap_000870 [Stephania japonica]|uniref:Protein LURP-one-related 5-like n=1 Tax=Stephania japonica TaxID=461633 RepID=A0AAP0KLG3_9MAGN